MHRAAETKPAAIARVKNETPKILARKASYDSERHVDGRPPSDSVSPDVLSFLINPLTEARLRAASSSYVGLLTESGADKDCGQSPLPIGNVVAPSPRPQGTSEPNSLPGESRDPSWILSHPLCPGV